MKFTISTYDLRTFTSVLWFIEKLKNNNTHHLFAGECIHHDVEDNKIIDFAAYDTDFKFIYEKNNIHIKRIRHGKPIFINSRCEVGQYEELILEFIDDENIIDNDDDDDDKLSDDKKIALIKKFIIEAKEKFDENKRFKTTKDKLILWSYSDCYWDDIKRINKRKFDTVILDPDVKGEIHSMIHKYNNEEYKEKLKSFGINHKLNLVLSGLPGTGKSSLMFSIATLLRKDIATIDFNNKDLTDHSFIVALNKIPKDCLFVLEDIDALYIDREKSHDNRVSFSCILNFLDGVYSKEDLVTIITTNHLNRLDKAILRPMRIDKIIKFTFCSKYQYDNIFDKFFPDNKELMTNIYKIIKNKKFTTSMLQKWFITYLDEPKELINNVKLFEELINVTSDKDYNMFT